MVRLNRRKKVEIFVSMTEPSPKGWRLDGSVIRFPKLGKLRAVIHRPLEGKPKTCNLKRDGNQWFVTIVCEVNISDPTPKTEPLVGVDRGVINIVADSNGKIVASPHFYESSLKKIARAQRVLSKRKKGSKNREKAKFRVTKLYQKTRRQREYFCHKLSHDYAKNHGTVVIEKLQIINMVKVGRVLARSILDQGWGLFAQLLEYKLVWSGGTLGKVNPAYSSQTCSECGAVDSTSRKDQTFLCTTCGHQDHADINAAKVIKSRWKPSVQPVESSYRLRVPRRSRKVVEVKNQP